MEPDEKWLVEYAEIMAANAKPGPADDDQIDLIRILAAEPGSGLVELAPGVWTVKRVGGYSAR